MFRYQFKEKLKGTFDIAFITKSVTRLSKNKEKTNTTTKPKPKN